MMGVVDCLPMAVDVVQVLSAVIIPPARARAFAPPAEPVCSAFLVAKGIPRLDKTALAL